MRYFCELLRTDYVDRFGAYLDGIISSRKRVLLRPSSKATYKSSITMILSTYLYFRTEQDVFNGHLDDILALERKYDNNANYSMQSCAIRHFKSFIVERNGKEWLETISPNTRCKHCLCGCEVCHADGKCAGVVECFGKCGKLYSYCRMLCEHSEDTEEGVCMYCVLKYSPLFDIPTNSTEEKRRARHIEYVNDHALVGRVKAKKYPQLLQREIMKNVRWHMSRHVCSNPLCSGWHP